jgi:hypothetical protein
MTYRDHRWMTPNAPPPEVEILQIYQTTRQFYQEAEYREAHDRHISWYTAMAEQHRRELQKMQRDIHLFGWFYRRRS